jgi:hypothetical protein
LLRGKGRRLAAGKSGPVELAARGASRAQAGKADAPAYPGAGIAPRFFNPGFALLPAVAAIAAVAPATITAASTAASAIAATAAAAAASTTTSAAVAASAATTAAATAFGLGLGFIHDQVAAAKILPVEPGDGFLGLFVGGYFDEGEPARLSREAVADERDS